MPGNGSVPNDGERLKVLADNAGIPELQTFEEDSGKIEAEQDKLRDRLDAVDTADELMDDPFFEDEDEEPTDDLDDEDLRSNRTLH